MDVGSWLDICDSIERSAMRQTREELGPPPPYEENFNGPWWTRYYEISTEITSHEARIANEDERARRERQG